MLGAEIDATVDVTAQDVLEAHRSRLKDAADLGFAVSQEEVPVDTGTLKQSGFAPEFRGEENDRNAYYPARARLCHGSR